MSDLPKIDFDAHPTYELGDTHLTLSQIVEETGVSRTTVYYHRKQGRLNECECVRVASMPGNAVAIAYDADLHAYLQSPRSYTYGVKQVDRERAVELLHTHPPKEAAEKLGCTKWTINFIYRQHRDELPSWAERRRSEGAYARQQKANQLHAEGWSVYDIADAFDMHYRTIQKYLRSPYDEPPRIEGRTPLYERDASEHGLWPTDL